MSPIDPNGPQPTGRKSKLENQALIDELIQYIEVGNYIPVACQAVGIGVETFYRWIRTAGEVDQLIVDKENEEELMESMLAGEIPVGLTAIQVRSWVFRERAQKASARAEAYAVANIRQQMPQQWTAAMTFLERRFPGRWKRKEQIDIGETESQGGIDESLLLADPNAVKLIHDALEQAAKGALPAPTEIVTDAVVVDDPDSPAI